MRILVTGSRDWTDRTVIEEALNDVVAGETKTPTVITGACPTGADAIAEEVAETVFEFYVERHPADWDTYGRKAGPLRNEHMVSLGADICLAFIKNGSKGATHTADLAERAGIPVRRFLA